MDYSSRNSTDYAWKTLLGSSDPATTPNSQPFTVRDKPVQILATGMIDGEFLCLHLFDAGDCDNPPTAQPALDCNGQETCMCCTNANIFIRLPGTYILVKRGEQGTPRVRYREVAAEMVS